MEKLSTTVERTKANLASPKSSNVSKPVQRIRYDENNLPLSRDHHVDVTIPGRVWSGWMPSDPSQPRSLVRELSLDEHRAVSRRMRELTQCLLPFERPAEDDRVHTAVAGLYGSFTSMRDVGASAVSKIANTVSSLTEFPAWAIEQACASIRKRGYTVVERDGRTRTEQSFAPSESQLREVVAESIRSRASALDQARRLLEAPVEEVAPDARDPERVEKALAEWRSRLDANRVETAAQELERAEKRKAHAFERAMEDRAQEFIAAGLAVPEGITTLSMYLRSGWRIEDVSGMRKLTKGVQ